MRCYLMHTNACETECVATWMHTNAHECIRMQLSENAHIWMHMLLGKMNKDVHKCNQNA